MDERKGRTLEDISQMVAQLTRLIETKKTDLAPSIKELRALRAQAQEIEVGRASQCSPLLSFDRVTHH
jgi:hypothetical protein